ncbi:hypothetical protein QN277_011959 [Acacia crassicarpa]|uniref:Uncharacterized protein n=1 Tax=Acacia crassicarpa TaxID=499986 RepID=A0AAE1N0H7_9FABA|nr:hypothetical protein QN277_011959 [Acacia crassicarpa]
MAFMASDQTPGGNQATGPTNDALYKELWHACAGPLVTLPREGEGVYYFPQGHMEQVDLQSLLHTLLQRGSSLGMWGNEFFKSCIGK